MFSVLGVVMMPLVWGESLIWVLASMGLFIMASSDNLIWKSSLMGEIDTIGWALALLSIWIVFLATLGSKQVKLTKTSPFLFISLNLLLLSALLITFYVSNFMLFYLAFEVCLVPIFLLILGWGYQPERAQAGVYMLFYTLFGSLPLFFFLFVQMNKGCSYMHSDLCIEGQSVINFFFFTGAFLVKFPMYSLHLWLLKAHVEAPLAGSMILAGVLLKLGGYGLVRILSAWATAPVLMTEVILCLSVWGGLSVSLSCLRQTDMKLLIASSSVVHMGLCVSGLLILTDWGFKGALTTMVGHGLCSSGLFYLANVAYERTGSRSMTISKGMLSLMPSMCLWWFALLSSNVGSPPSLNLMGEILLISAVVNWSTYTMLLVGPLSFFSACYSLYLFSLVQQGSYLGTKSGFHSGCVLEYMVTLAHWLPLNMMVVCAHWFV
nr:TPA_asm: ND4 [Crypturopus inflatus]